MRVSTFRTIFCRNLRKPLSCAQFSREACAGSLPALCRAVSYRSSTARRNRGRRNCVRAGCKTTVGGTLSPMAKLGSASVPNVISDISIISFCVKSRKPDLWKTPPGKYVRKLFRIARICRRCRCVCVCVCVWVCMCMCVYVCVCVHVCVCVCVCVYVYCVSARIPALL
jgi:hypothetical protein